jgi:two-component system NtrC family sensor kinase
MPETDPTRGRWALLTHSVSTKVILLLLCAMVAIFFLLGYLTIRLHRHDLEASVLASAERVSDVIKRSATYSMMRNDREGLYHVMQTIGGEPGMVKVRIFDPEGKVSYSTDSSEVGHSVDKSAEACYGCHAQSQPLARLNRPDRFRIYRLANGPRVLGIITPIENQPTCTNAECHAHPASQQVLGVLDTNISLAKADAQLAAGSQNLLAYTLFAVLIIAFLSWLLVWRFVGEPIGALKDGTERLANGDLGHQIHVGSHDEIGDLAQSFNGMSLQLQAANEEIVAWAKTLEDRVDQKTRELKRAHDHVLHVEKMATVGKMAAVVAHEINNPLSGILTYAKLLKKWLERGDTATGKRVEALECLELIAAESRRCGELVKNLLVFSRTPPMNVQTIDLNGLIERSLRVVQHQLDLNGILLQLDLAADIPRVQCDPAQIEQVLLALTMNAIDALPRGGNLWISTQIADFSEDVEIKLRDDGIGIPADVLPHIFEPFLTTKESGVGLGLAISNGIIERHAGRISVVSEKGKGTTFTITLPVEAGLALAAASKAVTNAR